MPNLPLSEVEKGFTGIRALTLWLRHFSSVRGELIDFLPTRSTVQRATRKAVLLCLLCIDLFVRICSLEFFKVP